MNRTVVDGKVLNTRTADMLHRAEQRLGYGLSVIQGSYNRGGVSASAGTHDGGGALDVSVHNVKSINEVVRQLRQVGFAAWHRLPSQGPWTEHIHAIAIGDPDLSSGAATQVREYYAGQNGLANHARDDGPRVSPIPTWPIKTPGISLSRMQYQHDAKKKKSVIGVKRIQHLLNYRLGTKLNEDGVFGRKTHDAYRAWEKHIHAPVSDGKPGKFSLSRLVSGYYRVTK